MLRKLLPADFRGQVAGILLMGIVLSQAMAAVLYMVLLPQWQRVLRPELAVEKVAMVARLLEAVSPAQRPAFAHLWDDRDFRIKYVSAARATGPLRQTRGGRSDSALRLSIAERLRQSLDAVRVESVPTLGEPDAKRIVVQLPDGDRLDIVSPVGLEVRYGLLEELAIAMFVVLVTGGLWAWLTWSVSAPLTRFAHAAERVGLDIHAPPMPEQGPGQLRRAIRAFNEMQVRLQRFLDDRTRMLGAISHDLRTPLTRLRLRIETSSRGEDLSKMLSDIERMEVMLSSALAFIRGLDEEMEAPDAVDLDSLLQTACDMVCDLGGEVSYNGTARCRYHCRPQAMLRALTNVVSNAAKYGRSAQVSLQQEPTGGYRIEVEDDGPGIPDAEKERVFEAFYRSAWAREVDSEGMGLGLSIARTIVLAHGGTIELRDRRPLGLAVRIVLPYA
ncbi:MAG TPA: ATP-binding protein [Steroidobacteraceae bacterium]|nr:ATP-binding protein [Steroidobacteraceae bacterium]